MLLLVSGGCWQQMLHGGGGVGEVPSFPTARVVREREVNREALLLCARVDSPVLGLR